MKLKNFNSKLMRAKWFSPQGLIHFCSHAGTFNIKDENNNVFMVIMNPKTTCTHDEKINCVHLVAVQISLFLLIELNVHDLEKLTFKLA